jgi:hypothetical protein
MAAVTKHLSFAITASTSFEPPFLLAKRFSTLDHMTGGRFGWNIVTSWKKAAFKAIDVDTPIEHDERYTQADEYMRVLYKYSPLPLAFITTTNTSQTLGRLLVRLRHNRKCCPRRIHRSVQNSHDKAQWEVLLSRITAHRRSFPATHAFPLPSRHIICRV